MANIANRVHTINARGGTKRKVGQGDLMGKKGKRRGGGGGKGLSITGVLFGLGILKKHRVPQAFDTYQKTQSLTQATTAMDTDLGSIITTRIQAGVYGIIDKFGRKPLISIGKFKIRS